MIFDKISNVLALAVTFNVTLVTAVMFGVDTSLVLKKLINYNEQELGKSRLRAFDALLYKVTLSDDTSLKGRFDNARKAVETEINNCKTKINELLDEAANTRGIFICCFVGLLALFEMILDSLNFWENFSCYFLISWNVLVLGSIVYITIWKVGFSLTKAFKWFAVSIGIAIVCAVIDKFVIDPNHLFINYQGTHEPLRWTVLLPFVGFCVYIYDLWKLRVPINSAQSQMNSKTGEIVNDMDKYLELNSKYSNISELESKIAGSIVTKGKE